MTHDWKPGDRAMVIVDRQVSSRSVDLRVPNELPANVWLSALHPLPAPDAITTLERAVVEAAIQWAEPEGNGYIMLLGAVNALRAARTPPDPVEELREAWLAFVRQDLNSVARMDRAIAALEAARKVGK